MVLMVSTFILNVLFSGGMLYFLLLIRSLQIVLHIPMLKVILPGNVSLFFSQVISVAMFDILDSEWTTKNVFRFDEEQQMLIQD